MGDDNHQGYSLVSSPDPQYSTRSLVPRPLPDFISQLLKTPQLIKSGSGLGTIEATVHVHERGI